MAKIHRIPVEFRDDAGKGASRRLRRAGKVPAILYGGDLQPRMLQLDALKAYQYAEKEWFYTSILELEAGGETQKALLRDVQRHPYKPLLTHIDFQRVSDTETIRLRVPLHFLNQDKSIAGKTSGCIILHELNDVEIECLPKDLPEYIELDLAELKVGDIIHLSDLKLPAGVVLPALKLGKEYDSAVVTAKMAVEEAETSAAPSAAEVPATAQKSDAKAGAKAAPAKAPEKKGK